VYDFRQFLNRGKKEQGFLRNSLKKHPLDPRSGEKFIPDPELEFTVKSNRSEI
jgi:hypothetical protein